MNCASCGTGLLDGTTFCGQCGAKVESAGVLRVTLDDLDSPTHDTAATPGTAGPAARPSATAGIPTPRQAFSSSPGLSQPIYTQALTARPRHMVGAIIGAIGALTVVIGSLVAWIPDAPAEFNAFKIDFAYLTDFANGGYTDDNNGIGILLVVFAILGAATSFIPKVGLIRTICGVGVLVVVILYLVQANRFLDAASFGDTNLGDLLGPGFYVTAAGGLLMAAAPPRWK